ncbi:Alpha/Beta hydrolase protein [Gautieria morchelliformis]|nr:Alpha/Beta hydrolase protein [Gautieria morchelliformis]
MHAFGLPVSIVLAISAGYAAASSQQPLALPSAAAPFDPHSYPQSFARCSAINRENSEQVGIDIQYVEVNPTANRTLLLVHGWPGLWSTWSNQIQHFEEDYHLIIPTLRGFGASTHPGDVQSSGTMSDMVSDMACVLQHANVQHKVVCVGHDWGSQICYEAARMRPDLVEAVSGTLPYISSAGPFLSADQLSALVPALSYQAYFEKHTREAAEELNASIRRTLRAIYRSSASPPPAEFLKSTTSFLDAWQEHEEIPPMSILTPAEEDYLVEQHSIQGLEKTLQFYTHGNRLGTWSFDRAQGNFSIPQPALSIYPTDDPVADWEFIASAIHSPSFFSQLTTKTMDAQHWPQLENPQAFNRILRDWLTGLPSQ